MNNTINQLKTLLTIYFKTAEYTCFPKEHRTFSRTDLALEQRTVSLLEKHLKSNRVRSRTTIKLN